MKNILRLTLIFAVLFALAACSKPGETGGKDKEGQSKPDENNENPANEMGELEPEEGAELTIWANGEGAEGEWIQYVAEEFSKQYDIPFKLEDVAHTDAPDKLQTDGPAGIGGDVFMAAHDHVGTMNTAGLIYENYFAEEYEERLIDGAVGAVSSLDEEGEHQIYGYPLSIETLAMSYNKDLLEEMNFEPAETMDELIEQSKQFMEKNPGTYGFMLEPGNFYGYYSFIEASGGYIFGEDNTNPKDIGLNNEGALEAAQLLERIRDEILPLKKEDLTGDIVGSYFDEGKSLYTIEGSWNVNNRLEAGINLGVIVTPKLANGEVPAPFLGVKGLYVNSFSDYPKAATLFAKFATSDDMLLKRFELTGELPPTKALVENEAITSDELKQPFLEQALYAVSMPNIPEMQSVWGAMDVSLSAIWNKDAGAKEALDRGVQQIEESIDLQAK